MDNEKIVVQSGVHQKVVGTKMASEGGRVSSRKGRPNYAREFKRQLAAAACASGVSVARLAQEHGINANLLFKWRRRYRAGQLGSVSVEQAVLLPVSIGAADEVRARLEAQTQRAERDAATVPREGTAVLPCIEIEVADATVRLRGAVDVAQLRLVLHCLRRTA
jgi:transposase